VTDQPWDTLEYRRIEAVAHRQGKLRVRFVNGDKIDVEVGRLLPDSAEAPDWDRVTCDGVELTIPTLDGDVYVFWETIRELTDPAYASRLKDADAAYRVRTGQQIRKLRQSRRLTGKYVAARAGINNQSLSRIENGRRGVTLTTLSRILSAMGCTLQDMVIDPVGDDDRSRLAAG
jgi:DNA-binding Xre family transcriptional regulator